jgi:MFS family permease
MGKLCHPRRRSPTTDRHRPLSTMWRPPAAGVVQDARPPAIHATHDARASHDEPHHEAATRRSDSAPGIRKIGVAKTQKHEWMSERVLRGGEIARDYYAFRCPHSDQTSGYPVVATVASRAPGGVLRHPVVRAILVAELISALGVQMTFLALPWFVLKTTGSATQMGLVLAVELIPAALLGIPSALVVQRIGVRRTLLHANLWRAPLLAAVPLLHVADLLSFPVLLAIVFAVGVFNAPYLSAQRLLLPETFADDLSLVVQGNAMVESVARLGMLLGPPLAGLAIGTLHAQNVLYINAATFAAAYLILRWRLPVRPARASAVSPDGRGVFAGARYAWANPRLRRITLAAMLFGFFFPPLLASFPVLTHVRYGEDPRVAGLFYAAWGGGALIGTLAVLPAARRYEPLVLSAIGAVGLAIPLWLLVLELSVWQFALVLLVSGVFTPVLNAPVITLMMMLAPVELRTKVITFILSMNLLAGPVAYALTGPVLDRWGVPPLYVGVALGVSVAAGVLVTLALERPPPPDEPLVPAPVPVPR